MRTDRRAINFEKRKKNKEIVLSDETKNSNQVLGYEEIEVGEKEESDILPTLEQRVEKEIFGRTLNNLLKREFFLSPPLFN